MNEIKPNTPPCGMSETNCNPLAGSPIGHCPWPIIRQDLLAN